MLSSPDDAVESLAAKTIYPSPPHPDLVAAWLGLFVEPGAVVELRALECEVYPPTISGYFDSEHLATMASEAAAISPKAVGVYLTLNPVTPDLQARACNRTKGAKANQSTKDEDILRRRWLYVDLDAKRPSGISATDAEKATVKEAAKAVINHLEERGWPAPIVADSGNGYALIYRVDLPADDGGLVHKVLSALAESFDGEGVDIDLKVSSRPRLTKIPGTLARKADSTPDRPHRRSAVVKVPGCADARDIEQIDDACIEVVPTELLEALAAETGGPAEQAAGTPSENPRPRPAVERRLLAARWLTDRGVGFRESDYGRGRKFILDQCPFNPEHKGTSVAIFQYEKGGTWFKCQHNSCSGNKWDEAKRAIGEPDDDHYDPPRTVRDRCPDPSGPADEQCAEPDAQGSLEEGGGDQPSTPASAPPSDAPLEPGVISEETIQHLTDLGNAQRLAF